MAHMKVAGWPHSSIQVSYNLEIVPLKESKPNAGYDEESCLYSAWSAYLVLDVATGKLDLILSMYSL